ncbi:SGNH/GDSL hydrolase family protein [Gracilibacillus sp. Marseille-QA3620]
MLDKKMISIFLVTLLLAGCGGLPFLKGKESAEHSKSYLTKSLKKDIPDDFIPTELSVVSVGDSLTQGVGASDDQEGYIPYLSAYLETNRGIKEATFTNYGVRGNRTSDLLNRLQDEQIKRDIEQADAVVITIGGNDIMKVVKEKFTNLTMADFLEASVSYEERIEKILKTIRKYNQEAEIYYIGLYNPFGKWMSAFSELDIIMDDWNEIGMEVTKSDSNAYFIRIDDIFAASDENLLYQEDYFHPNDRGYELIAARIYEEMKEKTVDNMYAVGQRNGVANNEEVDE